MAVKFYLDKRPAKISKEYPIRVSVCIKGTTLISTIGYSVDKKVFEAGRINKKNYKNAKGVTAKELNAKLSGLESHFATYDLETKSKPTKDEHLPPVSALSATASPGSSKVGHSQLTDGARLT